VRNTIARSILAAATLGLALPALADQAETKGGITVKTDDGRFEAKVGGRIHFDTYLFSEDDSPSTPAFGSETGNSQRGGFAFRRTYLTLTGKLYGWKYKFENDFAAGASPGSYREMWVSTELGPTELMIGQFKPFRGMEELTSSNEITMIERPWTSATGIYAGRQFLMGLGYKGVLADMMGFGVHAMGLGAANTTTEGTSLGARLYFFPLADAGSVLHFGLSASQDNADAGSATPTASAPYVGRRGPTQTFGTAGLRDLQAGSTDVAETQQTIAGEIGAGFGPAAIQFEYAQAALDATHDAGGVAGQAADSDVTAAYLQVGVFVTGEQVVYDKARGAFKKPNGAAGAWEITARYDMAENGDQDALNDPCGDGTGLGGAFDACEATTITVGTNWYVNPNVRFMLNYYMGEADHGTAGTDEAEALTIRTQLSF
jgi:phosphate-selective porin OprO/OprP